MAIEELIKIHGKPEENIPPSGGDDPVSRESLIQQVRRLGGSAQEDAAGTAPGEDVPKERVRCADGYERVSSVQAYRTPEDYHRRQTYKTIAIVAVIVIAILAVVALSKAGVKIMRLG